MRGKQAKAERNAQLVVSADARAAVTALANAMGTSIPGNIEVLMWSLPLLVGLHNRLVDVELGLKRLEGRGPGEKRIIIP